MNNFFFNLAKNFKKQNEFINMDIKESFIFLQNSKEEKELISLKEDLFKTRNTPGHKLHNAHIDVDKKNEIGEFDLSTLLPQNTQALLEMKKSYGFYLNRFLTEYNRMKKLNSVIYKEKIKKCYKTQNFIASELCACVENLMSSMDMYSGDTPTGNDENLYSKPTQQNVKNKDGEGGNSKPKVQNIKNKENEEDKNKKEKKEKEKNEDKKNINEINENKINENDNNKNKINDKDNNINEENKKNEGGNKKNNIEESDLNFNLIKDDNEKK